MASSGGEDLYESLTNATPGQLTAVQVKRNLNALWIAEFTAIFGFTLSFPFLPLFLNQVLEVHSRHEVAFWTAIVSSVTEFSLAICGPLWGVLADRYGRKRMLVRAMVGGGLSLALMGLSRSPVQLTIARALEGATSGTVTMASALVGAHTPRAQLARSMGILSSAVALGGASGPVVGGLIGSLFGLRATFLFGCFFLLLPTPLVMRFVVERRVKRPQRPVGASAGAGRPSALFAQRGSRLVPPLVVLLVAQFLTLATFGAAEQLVALRVLEVDAAGAAAATGIAFGVAGLATAVAGATYSRGIRLLGGYRPLAALAAVLMASVIVGLSFSPSKLLVILAFGGVGLLYGVIQPTLASMISLEAPAELQGRVFGISAGAIGVGLGAGPLIGALVASVSGVQVALLGTAGVGVLLAGVIGLFGGEPVEA